MSLPATKLVHSTQMPEAQADGADGADGADETDETVIHIEGAHSLATARMFARELCNLVRVRGYLAQKVVTAVGELVRNMIREVGEGWIRLRVDDERRRIIVIAEDHGPRSIPLELDPASDPPYAALDRELVMVARLADEFSVQTAEQRTLILSVFRF